MIIDENNVGIRIDKYLTDNTEYTRSKIKKMIENGNVLVNSKQIKSSYILKENDTIDIEEYSEEVDIVPENIPLDIYYEDDDLIVVNKPSGMVVHPAPGNYTGTLVNALMYHTNNLSTVNTSIRPGIVHRIDADTSGLLLVAKNDKAHNILAEAIAKKEVVREYIALVEGIILEDTATIDAPIGRDKNNRKKMAVTSENSKDAVTHIRVLERYNTATLIRCKLETGRTHQIRVHLNYIGHPVVNDPVYGYKKLIDKDFKEELKFDKSNSRNILLDFYEDIFKSNQYIIDNGDILLNTTIKNSFNVRGKYKSFLILFYLGLLQRKKDISKPNTISNRLVHTPTFIKIPIYTDELLKEANNKAKDLLSLNLNKLSYFLVRQEFGEEIADSIYKNLKCKSYYRYGLRAKEDIINFIKTDKEVLNFGFMTVEEIFDYVQDLNIKRKIN